MPPLRRLTFSPGDTLAPSDLAMRGYGRAGVGPFTAAALVIPSIGVDTLIETQTVPPSGAMPEPSSFEVIAWYDFSNFGGLGGSPLAGGNVVMAGNLGGGSRPGVLANLSGVPAGEILTLHLNDGRRLFYRVEFNKTVVVDGSDWTDIVTATANESMTLITAAGTQVGTKYTHRRLVWARRVNCVLLETPETPTRAPYVDCEEPV